MVLDFTLRNHNVFVPGSLKERRVDMDNVTIIRVVSAAVFVVLLFILVQRRRTRVR